MSASTITLWLLRETDMARQYATTRPGTQNRDDARAIWVPKSIIEHTSKRGIEHDVKLPDWFVQKEGL